MIWKYSHSSEYVELVRAFPLAPITSQAQHERAVSVLHDLALLEQMTPAQNDYFDVLSHLIRRYESELYSSAKVTPAELLTFLMEQHNLSQADIARMTGVQRAHISEFFSGKRKLPVTAAAQLGGHFKIDPASLLPKIQPIEKLPGAALRKRLKTAKEKTAKSTIHKAGSSSKATQNARRKNRTG